MLIVLFSFLPSFLPSSASPTRLLQGALRVVPRRLLRLCQSADFRKRPRAAHRQRRTGRRIGRARHGAAAHARIVGISQRIRAEKGEGGSGSSGGGDDDKNVDIYIYILFSICILPSNALAPMRLRHPSDHPAPPSRPPAIHPGAGIGHGTPPARLAHVHSSQQPGQEGCHQSRSGAAEQNSSAGMYGAKTKARGGGGDAKLGGQ